MKNTKRLKIGIYTVSVCLIAIAIAVFINALVGFLPSKFKSFDLSNLGLYDISKESEDIVKGIDEDVTMYLITQEGKESMIVKELIEKYCSLSSKLSYKVIDPVLHPKFTSPSGVEYNLGDYKDNTIIVTTKSKDKVVDYSEIFKTEYSYEEQYNYYYYGVEPTGTTSFFGESKLTGALEYVSSKDLPTLYLLDGHGETKFGDTLTGYLANDNYVVNTFSIVNEGKIPDDCDCVVINLPTSDLNSDEVKILSDFVKDGGSVIMITSFTGSEISKLANVCKLGEGFGISALDGIVVEGNASNMMGQYSYYLLPNLGSNEIASSLTEGKYAFAPNSHGLIISDKVPENVTATPILSTSTSAFTTDGTTIDPSDAIYKGEMDLGVYAVYSDGDDEKSGSFVWYSSMGITSDDADAYVSGGNSELFISTLKVLCNKEDSVTIAAKDMTVENLVVPDNASKFWSTLLTIVLPIVIIIPGIFYCLYRRKR